MASGRAKYLPLLHAVIAFTTCFLGSFGTLGLLRFGNDGVEQIATENLPDHSPLAEVVKGCLVLAILCTYPLQLFPVIQTVERWGCGCSPSSFFSSSHAFAGTRGGGSGGTGRDDDAKARAAKEPLIGAKDAARSPLHDEVSRLGVLSSEDGVGVDGDGGGGGLQEHAHVVNLGSGPLGAALLRWGGVEALPADRFGPNAFDAVELYGPYAGGSLSRTVLMRSGLVMLTSAVALLARNYFGYIAGVVGSLGATTLTFIMPSLMHLELFKGDAAELTPGAKAADYLTAVLGVVGGGIGIFVTVQGWVNDAD